MDWTHLWTDSLQWVSLHPIAAYLAIFLISLSESLALVGLLVPGTVMMVGIGALAGSGALSIRLTLLAAMAGAIAGDGISFWLGRHYHREIGRIWPFSRYPQMLDKGEAFFNRHGGKSVFFGRFVGPVRPVIPIVAGMLDMPAGHFLIVNILSAIGWAFAYLMPGVVLGTSMALVGAVSTRLAVLLFLFLGLLWLAWQLARRGARLLMSLGTDESRPLLVLGIALVVAAGLFLGVLQDLLSGDPLVLADQSVYHFLQALRNPWGDALLVAVTELGDATSNIAVIGTVVGLLVLRRQYRSLLYWLAAVGGGVGLVQLFKWLLHRPRPINIYQGISSWGFPSGHTTMTVVVYGFLALLLIRGLSSRWRSWPFVFALTLSLLVAFSRIYLGAHWLSDVLGGMALGWAWVCILGLFYLRRQPVFDGRALVPAALLALVLAGSWHIGSRHNADLTRYRVQAPVQSLSAADWWHQGYQHLPGWRTSLLGDREQPLTLQVAVLPEEIVATLQPRGWRTVQGETARRYLNLVTSHPDIAELPVLPQFAAGEKSVLTMIRPAFGEGRMVLRLWPSSWQLDNGRRIFVGVIETETVRPFAELLTLPLGEKDFSEALRTLSIDLSRFKMGIRERSTLPPVLLLKNRQNNLSQGQ